MKDLLDGHQVRVHEGASLADLPGMTELVRRLDLLVGPDRATLEAVVGTGVFPPAVRCLSLADAFPWREELGRPLLPLRRWWPYPDASVSTLRACALMGFALCQPRSGGEADPPIRRVLAALCGAGDAIGDGSRQAQERR